MLKWGFLFSQFAEKERTGQNGSRVKSSQLRASSSKSANPDLRARIKRKVTATRWTYVNDFGEKTGTYLEFHKDMVNTNDSRLKGSHWDVLSSGQLVLHPREGQKHIVELGMNAAGLDDTAALAAGGGLSESESVQGLVKDRLLPTKECNFLDFSANTYVRIDKMRVRSLRKSHITLEFWFRWQRSRSSPHSQCIQLLHLGMGSVVAIGLRDKECRAFVNFEGDKELLSTPLGHVYKNDDWHHIAFTYGTSYGIRRLYFDGELVAQDASRVGFEKTAGSFNVMLLGDSQRPFCGHLTELRMWDVEKTQKEIRELMYVACSAQPNRYDKNLEHVYTMCSEKRGNELGLRTIEDKVSVKKTRRDGRIICGVDTNIHTTTLLPPLRLA